MKHHGESPLVIYVDGLDWNGGSLGEVTFRALYGANKLTQGSQNMREQVTDLKHFFWIALWLWSVTKGNCLQLWMRAHLSPLQKFLEDPLGWIIPEIIYIYDVSRDAQC